jgi:hypothetical protein
LEITKKIKIVIAVNGFRWPKIKRFFYFEWLLLTFNVFFAYFECVLGGKIAQIKRRWFVHLETN